MQGRTLYSIIVDMSDIYMGSQAYVAFSRVKCLSCLYISNFNPKYVKVSKDMEEEMLRLQNNLVLIPDRIKFLDNETSVFKIVFA